MVICTVADSIYLAYVLRCEPSPCQAAPMSTSSPGLDVQHVSKEGVVNTRDKGMRLSVACAMYSILYVLWLKQGLLVSEMNAAVCVRHP